MTNRTFITISTIKRARALVIITLLFTLISGCQTQSKEANSINDKNTELQEIIDAFTGNYQGKTNNPAARKNPKQPSTITIFQEVSLIDAPQFGHTVMYHRLSRERIGGPAMQQKIYVFDTNDERPNNRMQAYYIKSDLSGTKTTTSVADLEKLDPSTLMTFPPECIINWHKAKGQFIANVKKEDCSFPSNAFNKVVSTDMTYTIDAQRFDLFEAMYTENGELIFTMERPISAKRIQQ